MLNLLRQLLLEWGLGEDFAAPVARAAILVLVVLAALIAHRLARGPVLRALAALIRRTRTTWDDILIERRVLHRLAHLVPGLVIYRLAPLALEGNARFAEITDTGVQIYLVLTGKGERTRDDPALPPDTQIFPDLSAVADALLLD